MGVNLKSVNNNKSKFRANVYVDGFNLYYGCLKDSKYKWLDLKKLSEELLSDSYSINKIFYCTAKLIDYNNSGITTRQGFYLNALKTIPELEIIFGKFKEREKTVFIEPPLEVLLGTSVLSGVKPVKKSLFTGKSYEEKGTDVNLATQLLIDLYEDNFDTAVVISNDTDYKMAIHQVRKKRKKIFVVNTAIKQLPQKELREVSSKSYRKITEEILKKSQFPEIINEKFRKPKEWE